MTKIVTLEVGPDAPLKKRIQAFNLNCIEGQIEAARASLVPTIHWDVVGLKTMDGHAEIEKSLRAMNRQDIIEYTIHTLFSEGTRVVSSGVMLLKSGQSLAFCDLYVLDGEGENAKIQEITTFGIVFKASA